MTEFSNSNATPTSISVTLAVTSIFMYMAAILLVFPSGNVEIYGFRVQMSFMQVLEAIMQVGPLPMAFCGLLTASLRDGMINKLTDKYTAKLPIKINRLANVLAVLQVHFLMALVFAAFTLVPVLLNVTQVEMISSSLTFYIVVSLIYDLTLIGIFVHFLFCLFRRWWAVWLTFIVYVLAVVLIGPALTSCHCILNKHPSTGCTGGW